MARGGEDPKVRALRAARSLNPRPEAVRDERFSGSEFLDARDLVQVKYEMVRRARVDGEPVGRAASAFGFSRPSFYAAERALDGGGLAGLVPARPGPRGAHKLTAEVVAFARERRAAEPKLSSAALVALITERFGVRVHASPIGGARARSDRARRKRGRPMKKLAAPRTSSAMSSCAREHSTATRPDGGSGLRCSSAAASWRGPALGPPQRPCRLLRGSPNRSRSATSSSTRSRAWRWRACPGGER